jgi:aerobic carbon-monoxide dehydrogenase small subunit
MEISKKIVKMTVNGRPYEVLIKPKTTLLQLLRNELGLTGAKQACMDNSCGACTVIVDEMALKACSILALQMDGKAITTVEGLASKEGQLSPLQEAFLQHSAFQCGFCTPGKLLSATAMLKENPHPTEEDIRRDMEGNLCRCTGYKQYIDAIMEVAQKKEGSKW